MACVVGLCTLCFCFPTKMLHLYAPFFPLKCSVVPKKVTKMLNNLTTERPSLLILNILGGLRLTKMFKGYDNNVDK